LVFKRGVTPTSWGSTITVQLDQVGDNETKLTFTTKETWTLFDMGRARRRVAEILKGLSAEADD
jgi:hypothetical protein